MKIISTLLVVLLSYNLSALACGEKVEVYKARTHGSEVAIQLANKEVLIVNSGSKAVAPKDEYSEALVPLRFEMASESEVHEVVVQTNSLTAYLKSFAIYRCIGTPVQTTELYLSLSKYSEVEIFLLKANESLTADRAADYVLKGEDALKLLK
ncbi:MAG: hypothetical protein JNL11_02355 [Bdellovibrionaceae bacterium]|nr:hypothetical protein [Pseudobdellovibrionaceae bacterium]